jgi:LPS-assembly protein
VPQDPQEEQPAEEPEPTEPEPTEPEPAEREPADEEEAPVEQVTEGADEQATPGARRAPRDRITFQLPFSREQGGGSASGSADSLEFERDTYAVLEGNVSVKYRNQSISAQRVEIDLDTKVVTAVGNVILDEGPNRLAGESMVWDLEANTGTLSEATAYMAPDMHFAGESVERIGDDLYVVSKGRFTSCPGEVPMWSFGVSRAQIRVEGFARAKHVTMRAKKLPFIYIPYIMYPAKQKRSSGLLMPNLGFSEARGYSLGLAYFQTMGRSHDATFYLDLFEEDYIGVGTEFRYRPTHNSKGEFEAYIVDDPNSEDLRWRYNWNHASNNLPLGLRAAVRFVDFSDFEFFRDFDRDLNRVTIRTLYSNAYVAGAWGPHSVNVLVDDREVLKSDNNNLTQNQLPEVEYRLRQTQLFGLPLYLQMTSGLHYFSLQRKGVVDEQWGRAYAFPTFTVPLQKWPWLSLNFSASGRTTYYTRSLGTETRIETDVVIDPETGEETIVETEVEDTVFTDQSLTRFVPALSAQIVGPSISKVFDRGVGSFSRFKHVVEPRWNYRYSDTFDRQDEVIRFDEIDRLQGLHSGTFTLTNRLVAKPEENPDDPDHSTSAREIMSLDLSQAYSFDNDQPLQRTREGKTKQSGPIGLRYRFNPSRATSLQASASYSTIYSQTTSAKMSGQFYFGRPAEGLGRRAAQRGLGRHNIGLSWNMRFDPESGDTVGNALGMASGFNFGRYALQMALNLDLGPKDGSDRPTVQQQRYFLQRNGKCTTWLIELREYRTATREDRDIRFAVSLKNIGTFFDLGTGTGNSGYQRGQSFGF